MSIGQGSQASSKNHSPINSAATSTLNIVKNVAPNAHDHFHHRSDTPSSTKSFDSENEFNKIGTNERGKDLDQVRN